VSRTTSGTPQGGVISPLLLCRTKKDFEQAEARMKGILQRLGLELHPDKTRRVELHGSPSYRLGRPRNAATRETTGKPCAGNPHARFEGGLDCLCPARGKE
jgi:hypothetical protein